MKSHHPEPASFIDEEGRIHVRVEKAGKPEFIKRPKKHNPSTFETIKPSPPKTEEEEEVEDRPIHRLGDSEQSGLWEVK